MSSNPTSKGLTHPFPMWMGCSVEELLLLFGVTIVPVFVLHVLISIFIGLATSISGFTWFRYGVFGAFVLAFLIFRYISIPIFGKNKKGKPNNFWRLILASYCNDKWLLKKLCGYFGINCDYSNELGFWDIRLKEKDNNNA